MLEYEGIKIRWLGHDSFLIKAKGKNIYIDPYKIEESDLPNADIVITSHEHFDHCNADSINSLSTENTVLIGPKSCKERLENEINQKLKVLELNPNEKFTAEGFEFSAIPAYNTHRFRSPGQPFHPKESGHIGPIINIDGKRIYHAGDTDKIPEMEGLAPDVALIPVSGTYVMDVEEGVEAAKSINAKVTIPMHVGRGIGELEFTNELKEKLPNMNVEVLELEE
ncbi:MAG: MBL fold metallo-hydrolase [Candidatus Kariarchaeaceae archaeon]|jgi:L-ascorbate metabolism protein UlaG (beta-lactamase superfamily)